MTLLEILSKLRSESSYFSPNDFEYMYDDYDVDYVDEVQLDEGRWTAQMLTILSYDGKLWGVAWQRGLTEMQENEFYPSNTTVFEVDKIEKVVYTYKKKSS